MKRKKLKNIILSVLGLLIVIFTMVSAFLFKDEIEKYAMTGYFGVLVACFASTSTILLPAPGILVVLQYAQLLNPIIVILIGGLGTSLGEMIGYLLGRSGREIINVDAKNKKILQWYDKKPYLIVLLFSFIPIPVFDVIGICAGMTKTNPIKFWLCCFIGKTIKMALFVFVFSLFKDFISCFL